MSELVVGVLAIQGDFAKHQESLSRLNIESPEVRTEDDLRACTHLIIPGGESTTVGKLLERFGLGKAIQDRAANGMPVWGTCMGLIMMAQEIEDREQYSLDLLDVTVRRNAFGAQVHSFETPVQVTGLAEPVMGVFIRAPIVTRIGEGVEEIARVGDQIVAARQGNRLGTSFHPELTGDTRMHAWFAGL